MRNRYLDLLRAAAILRVIVYHLFGWPWLTVVLPAMGVMFALAGSLMAASLDARAAGPVITSRLRRLLPPLWVFGLIAVPVMLAMGWRGEDGDYPLSIPKLAFWILPIGDPPGSEWGIDLWEPLWYLRAYLWFVLLSPMLYALYRRIGWAAVAAPIALLGVLDLTGFSLPDTADAALWDFVAYGACWIAGFAHHDGRLARTRPAAVLGAAAVLGGIALYWLRGHPGENGIDLNDVPESQALWSLAFVLVALRWQPPMDWLARMRPLDAAVNVLNARAVTIYLWHNVMIALTWPVLTFLVLDDLGRLDKPVTLATVLVLTALAAAVFGWVEDLAARRRPRLWPATRPAPGSPTPTPQDHPVSQENDASPTTRGTVVKETADAQRGVPLDTRAGSPVDATTTERWAAGPAERLANGSAEKPADHTVEGLPMGWAAGPSTGRDGAGSGSSEKDVVDGVPPRTRYDPDPLAGEPSVPGIGPR